MRVTGGEFRSRTLVAPRGQATRPTSDRVREALFSILASEGVFGDDCLRVLDLYAGSGALALEALSRGAAAAVLVENARPAIAAIRANVEALAVADRVTVVTAPVVRAVERIEGSFGLVMLDPPYAIVREPAFGGLLAAAARLLDPGGILVLEHASADTPGVPDGAGAVIVQRRAYGDTALTFLRTG